ncbi:alkyl hydroperoxide reductase/ Thiol specific antioxidant/ Mal allergen [Gloeomargarita lithophora Alchichica-D10]|uniref:thioredoxin-dependent peroxiredoxin n=1 Tax=Gloeomargarita lithophora Alchichica-D10 TaxID=1188229 RepID=A0A1J0AGA5_9CYAN|nr:peroxiredoxin [Gloeomargarita lithophora]APB34972.1 alkyl hydroperoxide reductase/ Thiol specific antioxidant/ Mal allergen [Gloeomargarita lithophora Alchichica-D10]
MAKITVGMSAPDWQLPDTSGQLVTLQQFQGQWVVLYFYPKDDTPGCTAEACAFRDNYEAFQTAGAVVIGVSGDDTPSHERFKSKYNLPFILVSDANNQLRRTYGVPATFGLIPGRVTYVIDPQGVVRLVFDSQFDFRAHVDKALAVIKATP